MDDDTSEQKKALSENQGEDNLNKPNKLIGEFLGVVARDSG